MGIVREGLGFVAVVAAIGTAGCGGAGFASRPLAHAPEMPTEPGQAKCKIAASQENPLVTEWPASEKANLEARLREGAVVVSYSGCTLKMLPRCPAPGSYRWSRTTPSADTIEIRNADELYAKLPIGALSLEGELQRTGRIAVQTMVSGQMRLVSFQQPPSSNAECTGATHVVSALSVGAFKLRSGGAAKLAAAASVSGVGSANGSSSSDETVMREAGNPEKCGEADDAAPQQACASPLQIFLQPLASTIAERGPPGTLKARFHPVRANEKWEVMVGDRAMCTTPCERWVDPAVPFTLKYDPGFLYSNQYIEIPDLREHASKERVSIRVTPRATGQLVGGILITTFAAIAAATGTVLTAVGCGGDKGGMCAAGLITLPIGLAGLVPGIWMVHDSRPRVEISELPTGAPMPQTNAPTP